MFNTKKTLEPFHDSSAPTVHDARNVFMLYGTAAAGVMRNAVFTYVSIPAVWICSLPANPLELQ